MYTVSLVPTFKTEDGALWLYPNDLEKHRQIVDNLRAKGFDVNLGFDNEENCIAWIPDDQVSYLPA